jgi:excinuclease ABC subunit A
MDKADLLTSVVMVDQSPIGRTPRSNPVTYIKAFDLIREIFARTPEAEKRGYEAGHFSFNIPGGRCETCQGDGTVTVEMQFLADVELMCEECKGTRYKQKILDVKYLGLNIHEVLQLTVREALTFFADSAKLAARLKVLSDVGLGLSASRSIGHHVEWRRSTTRETRRSSSAGQLRRNVVLV